MKTTSIASISSDHLGNISVRIDKTATEGQEKTILVHRVSLSPGDDVAAILTSVNTALVADGFPELGKRDMVKVKAEAKEMWTPEVRAAYSRHLASLAYPV